MNKRSQRKILRYWLITLLGIVLLAYQIATVVVDQTRNQLLRDQAELGKGEVIFPIAYRVVDGDPGPIYKDRLDATISLWRKKARPIWLLAGRHVGLKESVSRIGQRYLIGKGIPATAIKVLDQVTQHQKSRDTTEEVAIAAHLAKQMGISRVIVVAEVTHLAQARLVFGSHGVNAILASAADAKYGFYDQLARTGALLVTLVDRRGYSLFWVRWLRANWSGWL